jgi:hypothetical protein
MLFHFDAESVRKIDRKVEKERRDVEVDIDERDRERHAHKNVECRDTGIDNKKETV